MAITKVKEISLFQSLMYSEGYLYEFFKNDIAQIISNINNDFPIDMNCSFQSVDSLKEIEKDLRKKYRSDEDERVNSLCESMLTQDSKDLYLRVVKEIGLNETIKMKRKLGIQITDEEIDFLLDKNITE